MAGRNVVARGVAPRPGAGMLFAREVLARPFDVGALAPSSPYLARQAVLPVPLLGEPTVIEVGAGTGVFTAAIVARLGGRGRFIAVERNPRFVAALRRRLPHVDVVRMDASELEGLLADRGLPPADVIVSTLPWSTLAPARQREILATLARCLAPTGALTTVAYSIARLTGPGRRFAALLRETFAEVVPGRTEWRNLLPAMVYYARQPRSRVLNLNRRAPALEWHAAGREAAQRPTGVAGRGGR